MSADLLKNVYLFSSIDNVNLDALQDICQVDVHRAGDVVFSEGEDATALYVIKHGSVRITQNTTSGDKIEIAVLGAGSHFGEMAFVDGERRSASAEAIEDSEVVRMDYSKLKELLANNDVIAVKVFHALAHFLCGRLRTTTQDLNFAREMNLRHF